MPLMCYVLSQVIVYLAFLSRITRGWTDPPHSELVLGWVPPTVNERYAEIEIE